MQTCFSRCFSRQAAAYFQVAPLLKTVESELCGQVNASNALQLLTFADTYEVPQLYAKALRAARRDLELVATQPAFNAVSLPRLLSLLMSGRAPRGFDIGVTQSAVTCWARANRLEDADTLAVLLATTSVRGERAAVVDGRMFVLRGAWLCHFNLPEGKAALLIKQTLLLRAFDPAMGTWQPSSSWQSTEAAAGEDFITGGSFMPALVALNGNLYAVNAGLRSQKRLLFPTPNTHPPETTDELAAMHVFIPAPPVPWDRAGSLPGTWYDVPTPIPLGRSNAVVASFGATLIVAGGLSRSSADGDTFECLARCDIFHPDRGAWVEGPAMLEPRCDAAAVVFEGDLYVIGGASSNGQPLSTVEKLTMDGGWQPAPSLKQARRNATAFVFSGSLFAGSYSAVLEKMVAGEWVVLPEHATAGGGASVGSSSAGGAHIAESAQVRAADRRCNYMRSLDGTCFDIAYPTIPMDWAARIAPYDVLYVASAGSAGEGLFTSAPLAEGHLIELTGRLIETAEAERAYASSFFERYAVDIDGGSSKWCLVPEPNGGGLALYFSNCGDEQTPCNCEIVTWAAAGCAVPYVRLFLRTQRAIATNEELRWDYGPQYNRTWLAKKARI